MLVGVDERGLALLKGPSSSIQQPGCDQRERRDNSGVRPDRTRIVCSLCRTDLSVHHGIYIWALHAEDESVLLRRSLKSSGFSPLYDLIPLMTLMRLPVNLLLESPIFAVLVLGSQTLCLVQQCSPSTI